MLHPALVHMLNAPPYQTRVPDPSVSCFLRLWLNLFQDARLLLGAACSTMQPRF